MLCLLICVFVLLGAQAQTVERHQVTKETLLAVNRVGWFAHIRDLTVWKEHWFVAMNRQARVRFTLLEHPSLRSPECLLLEPLLIASG